MNIVVENYEIKNVIDSNGNVIELENLIYTDIRLWNAFCVIEAMLGQRIKKYDYEEKEYIVYYPYRKYFLSFYGDSSFEINIHALKPFFSYFY